MQKNYSMVKTAEQRIYCWRTFRLHFAEFNNLPMEEWSLADTEQLLAVALFLKVKHENLFYMT